MQVIHILWHEVGQVTMLCVIPTLLYRIKFRRVGGQLFKLEPIRMLLLKIGGNRTMHIPPVPYENYLLPDMPVHFCEKPDEILRLGIVRKELKIERQPAEGWGEGDRSDPRDPVVPVPGFLDRRVARQRPGASANWLEHEARFVEESEC